MQCIQNSKHQSRSQSLFHLVAIVVLLAPLNPTAVQGVYLIYRCSAHACSASAFIAFRSAFSAGVSVDGTRFERFDGRMDLRRDFVEAIVEVVE